MRIVVMGTPEFGLATLEELNNHPEHKVLALYSQAPAKSGRGQKLNLSATHQFSLDKGIPVRTPSSLKDNADELEYLKGLDPDIIVVAAYGLILPPEILAIGKYPVINVHASLLPRWRGANPMLRAIEAGDTLTGISIMKVDEGIDTGPVMLHQEVVITEDAVYGELYKHMSEVGAKLLIKALTLLENEQALFVDQVSEGVTYAKRIKNEEKHLNFNNMSSIEIWRKIRALSPMYAAIYEVTSPVSGKTETIKIYNAVIEDIPPSKEFPVAKIGQVVDNRLGILCNDNKILRLLRVQRPGKNVIDAKDFLNSFNNVDGNAAAVKQEPVDNPQ